MSWVPIYLQLWHKSRVNILPNVSGYLLLIKLLQVCEVLMCHSYPHTFSIIQQMLLCSTVAMEDVASNTMEIRLLLLTIGGVVRPHLTVSCIVYNAFLGLLNLLLCSDVWKYDEELSVKSPSAAASYSPNSFAKWSKVYGHQIKIVDNCWLTVL